MPAAGHGKSGYPRGRGEQQLLRSCQEWQKFPAGITHRPRTRKLTSGSNKGSLTAHDNGVAFQPSEQRHTNIFEEVSDKTTLAPPLSGHYDFNEDLLPLSRFTEQWQTHNSEKVPDEATPGPPLPDYYDSNEYLLPLSQPTEQRRTHISEKVSDKFAPALPLSSYYGWNEESLPLPQPPETLFEKVFEEGFGWGSRPTSTPSRSQEEVTIAEVLQEDPCQNHGQASLVSDPWFAARSQGKGYNQRTSSIWDEFDSSNQPLYTPFVWDSSDISTNLFVQEQDSVLSQVKNRLSQSAFDLIANYQFSIPRVRELTKSCRLKRSLRSEDQEPVPSQSLPSLIKEFNRIIDRRFIRNLKYWRHAQLAPPPKEESASGSVIGSKISAEDESSSFDRPAISYRLIAEWKARAGKKKDWSSISIGDLLKKDNLRGRDSYKRRCVLCEAVNWLGHDILQTRIFTAASLHEVPRGMLRSYKSNSAQSGLIVPMHMQRGIKRRPKSEYHEKKPRYLDSARKAKRNRASDIKELISEEISFLSVVNHNDSAAVDTVLGIGEWSPSCPLSDRFPPTKLSAKGAIFLETNTSAADALSIPYESRIGAILGGRFVLRGLIATKLCYDVHTANDLYTGIEYTAKAYNIRGTKGNERKHRITSLKRNASKASCIASVDQGGRKWLFSSGGIEHIVETGSPSDVSAWYGEGQYQHHFPSLSGRCTIAYTPPQKTYASCVQPAVSELKETNCVQEVSSPWDDRMAKRKDKIRDRQRNKRKQKRIFEAVVRKATDDEAAQAKQTSTSVHESRSSPKSRAGPKLGKLSIAGILFAAAELAHFLESSDEVDRLYPEACKMIWHSRIDVAAETFKRHYMELFAGYRTMAGITARTDAVNLATVQMLQDNIGSSETAEAIRDMAILMANLGK